jgi:hypothetical protein
VKPVIGCVVSCLVLGAHLAYAQPVIISIPMPAPNSNSWTNSPVRIQYSCNRVESCPEPVRIATEGPDQEISASVHDADGLEVSRVVVLNIDFTAPTVMIESPAAPGVTTAPSIAVVAQASDATSRLSSATCNGIPAVIDQLGKVRCSVALMPGINDVVVEVSDLADNSRSAGFRIKRVGPITQLRVIPEIAGVLIGSTRTLQVLDGSGVDVRDVVWHVDNPFLANISTDGKHALTARAPGVVTVTATYQNVSATSVITIYPGDRLPATATRWKVGSVSIFQYQPGTPGAASDKNMIHTEQRPAQAPTVMSINEATGRLNWREAPAMNGSDAIESVREQQIGGAVMVVTSKTDGSWSVVRGGPSAQGRPWRYRSAGRLDRDVVMDRLGGLVAIETNANGFPSWLAIDGPTGGVIFRDPLPTGVHIAMNVACVKGANSGRLLPAQVGPPAAQLDGSIMFALVRSDDREDFERCGSVSGRLQRSVQLATITPTVKKIDLLRMYEVPAGSKPPTVTMFPVIGDGHGGFLVPWIAEYRDTGAKESKVMRISAEEPLEFTLPAVGKIWLSDREDLAATTDGSTVVVFNVLTGAVRWSRFFEKGVAILSAKNGEVLTFSANNESIYDSSGRLVRPPKPRQ